MHYNKLQPSSHQLCHLPHVKIPRLWICKQCMPIHITLYLIFHYKFGMKEHFGAKMYHFVEDSKHLDSHLYFKTHKYPYTKQKNMSLYIYIYIYIYIYVYILQFCIWKNMTILFSIHFETHKCSELDIFWQK